MVRFVTGVPWESPSSWEIGVARKRVSTSSITRHTLMGNLVLNHSVHDLLLDWGLYAVEQLWSTLPCIESQPSTRWYVHQSSSSHHPFLLSFLPPFFAGVVLNGMTIRTGQEVTVQLPGVLAKK